MDVSGWFTQSVTIAHLTGISGTGAETYGPQATVGARIKASTGIVRRAKDGAEVVSSHVVYVPAAVGIEDALWLPGDSVSDPSVAKKPIRVDVAYDRIGTAVYWKVTL